MYALASKGHSPIYRGDFKTFWGNPPAPILARHARVSIPLIEGWHNPSEGARTVVDPGISGGGGYQPNWGSGGRCKPPSGVQGRSPWPPN